MKQWSAAALTVFLLLSGIPVGGAQEEVTHLLVDNEGDVQVSLYDQGTSPPAGAYDAVDLVSLDVIELPAHIRFVVGVSALPSCPNSTCWDSGDTRTYFSYGQNRYEVQLGMGLTGFPYANLYQIFGDDFNGRQQLAILDNTADAETATYTVDVPREHLVDHNGAPPRKDAQLTNIESIAFSQTSFAGPDPDNLMSGGSRESLATYDRMGHDAPASITFTTGGVDSSGPVTLTSPAPYRASNGGEGGFVFHLQAIQFGDEEELFDLEFDELPTGWALERPAGVLKLPFGTQADFSILVTTPFGHKHGGAESFTAKIVSLDSPDVWASVELGIHYVAVPQPSGHHPTLWFHSTANQDPFATFSETFGGTDGAVYMNTVEEDGGDEKAAVQGFSTTAFGPAGYAWYVCLQPDLLIGLDVNMSKTGTLDIALQSARGHDDVVVSGRMLHVGPGDEEPFSFCHIQAYQDRKLTEIATIEPSNVGSVGATPTQVKLDVLPDEAGDYIPFKSGTTMLLEIQAIPSELTPAGSPSGPEGMELAPGGLIALPLDEYHDERPSGLVGWNDDAEMPVEDNLTADSVSFIPAAEVKESPSLPVLFLIAGLAGTVLAARRRLL